MTTEDLTGYTESDASNHLTETATTVTFTSVTPNETTYLYKDFGAGHFLVNSYFEGEINVTNSTGSSAHFKTGYASSLAIAPVNETAIEFLFSSTTVLTWRAYKYESSAQSGNFGYNVTGSTNTTYYYRAGIFSAFGQYGGVAFFIYTDAARTNLLTCGCNLLTATASYQYFLPFQSFSVSGAVNMSGTNANLTLYNEIVRGRDLTTATLSGSHLAAYTETAVATAVVSNENTYLYYDDGVGYYTGNWVVQGAWTQVAIGATNSVFCILSLSNTAGAATTTSQGHGLKVTAPTTLTNRIYIREGTGSGENLSASYLGPYNTTTPLWIKLWRDTSVGTYGTLYAAAYGDSGYVNQFGSTISLALTSSVDSRYFLPFQSYNNGAAGTSTLSIGSVLALNTIHATKGAFNWAGKTSLLSSQVVNASIGAFSWAGKTSNLSTMVQATKGAFNWVGKFSSVSTGNTMSSTKGAFGWAGKSSPLSFSIAGKIGSFGWAGKTSILGATVTSIRTWEITKWDIVSQKEIPVTGLTNVLYMLYNPSTGHILDFADNTFKASSACTTPQGTMTERILLDSHGNNLTLGIYDILLSTTGLSGLYQEFGFYYGTNNYFNSNPVRFQDGTEYLGGLTVAENSQLMATVLNNDPRMDLLKYKHILNPVDGTVKYYDGSNNLKYSGLAYMDAAMTRLYDGTAPVVATSWIS